MMDARDIKDDEKLQFVQSQGIEIEDEEFKNINQGKI